MDLFKALFCRDITLEQLTDVFGYDEDTIIDMLDGKIDMTDEEKCVVEELLREKICR